MAFALADENFWVWVGAEFGPICGDDLFAAAQLWLERPGA